MNRSQNTLAATAAVAAFLAFAAGSAQAADAEVLRTECAARHDVALKAGGANEHVFVYHRGELRGELQPGQALPCSPSQYQAHVARLDPARLMALQPTAAGKPAVDENVFTYKKGVLQSSR